jgi:carboxylesterase type B
MFLPNKQHSTHLHFLIRIPIFAMQLWSLLSLALSFSPCAGLEPKGLRVTASTGNYRGRVDSSYSNVRAFLSIPYAKPPTNTLRWQAPQRLSPSKTHYDVTKYGPACPQYIGKIPTVLNSVIPGTNIDYGSQNKTAGAFAETSAEDCLSLAIWTPVTGNWKLPVLVFMTGGHWALGGVTVPWQNPAQWVARSQSHIVVTINYRVNIMGYPNAAGLPDQNLGFLDQRMALEWVEANIAAFGGNPKAITLWGESAGAGSVDVQNFAFHGKPIARAFIMMSGTTYLLPSGPDVAHTNFSYVANGLGCHYQDAAAELECMRKVPVKLIENFVGHYADNATLPALSFGPVPDDKIVFSDYKSRYAAGLYSKVPAIIGNCANEGAALFPLFPNHAAPPQAKVNGITLSFVCGSANASALRYTAGLRTYRYQHAGNFSNVSPLPWLGAPHTSDLPMAFGTYGEGATPLEVQTSTSMQDYFLAFARDPMHGLEKLGWVGFDPTSTDGGRILRFGSDGKAVQTVSGNSVEGVCTGDWTYNPFP